MKLKDILNYNFVQSSSDLNYFKLMNVQPRNNVFRGVLLMFKGILSWFLKDILQYKRLIIPKNNGVFVYETINNYQAMKNIKENIKYTVWLGKNGPQVKYGYIIPRSIINLISLFFTFRVFYFLINSKGYTKKSLKHFFSIYLETYGVYYVVKMYFNIIKPKFIALSNPHEIVPLAFTHFCKKRKIPTFFITHGTIDVSTGALPFDYSFFPGRDILSKYSNYNDHISSIVFLLGNPQFDKYISDINKNKNVKRICFASNLVDDVNLVSKLLKFITKIFPEIIVTLRPHPAESLFYYNSETRHDYYYKLANELEIYFSDPYKENVFDCLKKNDVIIACDSGILLDAALLNVYPIYFDYRKIKRDKCGFVRNGLADYINDESNLVTLIKKLSQKKKNIRSRAKYYCTTIDTKYDGRSTELAVNIINQAVQNGEIDMSNWKIITEYKNIDAYEPYD